MWSLLKIYIQWTVSSATMNVSTLQQLLKVILKFPSLEEQKHNGLLLKICIFIEKTHSQNIL